MIRTLVQPGPATAERHAVVECGTANVPLALEPGRDLLGTVGAALLRSGYDGAYLRLRHVPVSRLAFVIPAASPDADHVAWYSETFAPDGPGVIEDAGLFVGRRQGEPFIHCHGIWRMADGVSRMGHLLAQETELSELVQARGIGLSGAWLETRVDLETNFHLFAPVTTDASQSAGNSAFLCTVRPNQDIGTAIETICRENAITDATVMGIGSLVGAEFEDGSTVRSHATEVLIEDGVVKNRTCRLDIAIVGIDGAIHRGRLVPGRNGVCITFELLILPEG